ncbi:MAG: hypothetical protein QOI06_2445 [Nocardioidaceae bacterium]|jgi:nucleotide-binding universal stress UspA family protein|nr:hypothetical protein [Nocardioidaceae bacterium]
MKDNVAPIVVGVDNSDAARAALRFALGEASRRGCALDVVTVWSLYAQPGGTAPVDAREWTRAEAQHVQDCAVASVLTDYDAAPPILSRQVIEGDPAQVLLRIARNADYLVVGSGRKGPMKRLLAGSVSEFCVRHAACPVLVVPAPMNDNMPEAQLQPACP